MTSHRHPSVRSNKTVLLMIVACALPLLIIGVIYFLDLRLNLFAAAVLILLCPLSHILIMRYTEHEHHSHPGQPTE